MSTEKSKGIVNTLAARCKDCYRCVRECPVKAICVKNGQASVEQERCISCGVCIKVCPQNAKTYRNDIQNVKMLLSESKGKVVASVAPSFAAIFSNWQANRLPSILRKLGFSKVSNTAEGAYLLAKDFLNLDDGLKENSLKLVSACPAVVNYVEKYKHDYIESLTPLVSPMIAHAKMLKKLYSDETVVIFIGPCICKKFEADRPEFQGLIDAVLTFDELKQWFVSENINFQTFEDSGFDNNFYMGDAGVFPIPGGIMKTAKKYEDNLATDVIHTSGDFELLEMLKADLSNISVVDALFCNEGCLNGPGISDEKNVFQRRNDLLEYYKTNTELLKNNNNVEVCLKTNFKQKIVKSQREVPDAEIQKVLAKTGKQDAKKQLNCGACGYQSCVDNAIAVVNGIAQTDMCIPYMRMQAEQRMDMIMETIPHGIVILDDDLRLIGMNPAFRKMFLCSDATLGRRISYLMDSKDFEKIVSGVAQKAESTVTFNGSKYHQFIYSLQEHKQHVGIYTKIDRVEFHEDKLNLIKSEVIEKALEIRDCQIKMANDFAMILGQNTAKAEEMLCDLMNVYDETKS